MHRVAKAGAVHRQVHAAADRAAGERSTGCLSEQESVGKV